MVISPITETPDVTLLATLDCEVLSEKWKRGLGIDIAAEFHGSPTVQKWCCNRTGLLFFSPQDIAGSAALYEELQKIDWYYVPTRWEYQVALRDLRGCSKILEIGSGIGDFLRHAKTAGLNVRGIEINAEAVRAAQAQGLPVELRSLESAASEWAGEFDAFCHFQVLEHVADPRRFLVDAVRLLRPGGKMICGVPNNDCFLFQDENLLNLPPHHMTLWSRKTFRSLEEYFPIRLIKCAREPLGADQIVRFVEARARYWRRRTRLARGVFNKMTIPIWREILQAGLRRYVAGHSLYVVFLKQPALQKST